MGKYDEAGKIHYYEGLRDQVPAGLLRIMQIPGVGPKTTRRFWVELQVDGPAGPLDVEGQLDEAADSCRRAMKLDPIVALRYE